MRILIAEDDFPSREVLRVSLEHWGHEVVACEDGRQAWEIMKNPGAPRLAILDWMMPHMDGLEVCRNIRELPHSNQTYVIVLTARGSREDLIEGLDSGADDFTVKPFDRQELKARLQVRIRVITLQEKLIEAERNRVLVETAGAAAHEINQPLTVLMAKSEMLLEDTSDERDRKTAQSIMDSVQEISKIVNKMVDARQYVTRSYIQGVNIVDFDQASEGEDESE